MSVPMGTGAGDGRSNNTGASDRLWNALGSVLYPRWLYRGPYWWRSVNAWWLQWWGAAFFYTDPWRPFRAPRD